MADSKKQQMNENNNQKETWEPNGVSQIQQQNYWWAIMISQQSKHIKIIYHSDITCRQGEIFYPFMHWPLSSGSCDIHWILVHQYETLHPSQNPKSKSIASHEFEKSIAPHEEQHKTPNRNKPKIRSKTSNLIGLSLIPSYGS